MDYRAATTLYLPSMCARIIIYYWGNTLARGLGYLYYTPPYGRPSILSSLRPRRSFGLICGAARQRKEKPAAKRAMYVYHKWTICEVTKIYNSF